MNNHLRNGITREGKGLNGPSLLAHFLYSNQPAVMCLRDAHSSTNALMSPLYLHFHHCTVADLDPWFPKIEFVSPVSMNNLSHRLSKGAESHPPLGNPHIQLPHNHLRAKTWSCQCWVSKQQARSRRDHLQGAGMVCSDFVKR